MTEGLDGAAHRAMFAALVLAALLGVAWLVGVRRHDAMLEARHARDAFAAEGSRGSAHAVSENPDQQKRDVGSGL